MFFKGQHFYSILPLSCLRYGHLCQVCAKTFSPISSKIARPEFFKNCPTYLAKRIKICYHKVLSIKEMSDNMPYFAGTRGFLLFYFISCLITTLNNTGKNYLINIIVVSVDILLCIALWIIIDSVAKNKGFVCHKRRKAISVLKILKSVLRLIGSALLLANVIINVNNGTGSLGINILVLMFSIVTLFFLLIKEYVLFVIRYFRYKAKQEIQRFNEMVYGERIDQNERLR